MRNRKVWSSHRERGSVLASWRECLAERISILALQVKQASEDCGKQRKQARQIETGLRETRAGGGEEKQGWIPGPKDKRREHIRLRILCS